MNKTALLTAITSLDILPLPSIGSQHTLVQLGNFNPAVTKVAQRNLQLGNIDSEVTKVRSSITYNFSDCT